MKGFFALFPVGKKCTCLRESECEGALARQLTDSGGLWRGSDEWVQFSGGGANPTTGTDAPTRPSGPNLRASRLSGSASSLQQGVFGTGTRKRLSVLMTSHRFLLADGSRVRGLASPHPFLGATSTCCLRRTVWDSSGLVMLPYCAFFDSGYNSCVSLRWLWWLFHTFPCEGGPRILRLILGRSHGFPMSPSCSAATGSVSLPCEVYRKLWIYWEMTVGIFRIAGMLRVPFGRRLAPVAWQHGQYEPEGQCLLWLWQWHKLGWFCWFRSSRCFSSVVVRP